MTRPAYRIDGTEVPEATFYAAACDPQRSVVVEACAGAGKTWMLVSRMLRALLDGTAPEQILAITFTRRAAAEMRERLETWLHDFAGESSSEAQRVAALVQRGLPEAAALALQAQLAGLRRRLQRGPRGVEVRTFHAWFAQLALQMPLQLRARLALPAEFSLLEDPQALQSELMRRLRRRCHADAVLRDDHDALVQRHRRSAVDAWLHEAWRRGDELALADAAGVLESSVPPAQALFAPLRRLSHPLQRLADPEVERQWRQLVGEMAQRSGVKARQAADALGQALQALRDGAPETAWPRAWQALFTKAGTPRQHIGSGPVFEAVVAELQLLSAALAQQSAHEDHLRLVRLSRVLRAEYQRLKQQRALVDMADLERAAHALLSDPAAAGWVAQRLDQRVRQVLIDEFQDTSPLQWHALVGWLSGYAGAGGGASGQRPPAVFIVGDPKQSIYRFRRAEPRVFEAARQFVVQGLGGQALSCDHTRRNAPPLVAALNQVFGDAALQDGWTPFRAHTTGSADPGQAAALPEVSRPTPMPGSAGVDGWRDSLTTPRSQSEERAREIEARQVASSVAALLREPGMRAGRVMVLARRRAMLRLLAAALAEVGVPCVMPESLPLAQAPEALDLAAVLDVLASPGHDLSLARALKSPLFGCSDDDLLWLSAAARDRGGSWLDTLERRPAGSAALSRAAQLLPGWRRSLQHSTPHELLDRIVHEGDYEARLMAALPASRRLQARQVLQGLLRAAIDHGGGRFLSPYAFVRALRQGLLEAGPAAPADAVQLLTVHGAKGLEADVVYLADTHPGPRAAVRATLLVDWPVDSAAPRRAAFVARESAVPPSLADALLREQAERLREEVNALYVAVTRARQRLVVSHSVPHRQDAQRSWWQRLQPVLEPLPEPSPVPGTAQAGLAWVRSLPAPPQAAVAEAAAQDTPLDAAAAALGRAVHRLLEWIGRPGQPLPRPQWAAAAQQAARSFGVPAAGAAQVLAVASAIADSEACARFFDGAALRWAGTEVPMALAGRVLRVDRLVQLQGQGAGTWWVLDYKLGLRPQQLAAHREQLLGYREAVRAALAAEGGTAARVEAGFVTGDGGFVPI